MKTHTTFTLRTLILNDMNVDKHQLTAQEIGVWLRALPDITKEMFETIYFFTHSIFQVSLIKRQIQQIRQESINLLDAIDQYQNLPPQIDQLKSDTVKCLEQVLGKIDADCGKYIEQDILMPVMHLKREKIAIARDLEALTALLKDRGLASSIVVMATEGMQELLKAPRCYYYRMIYIKKLQSDLILLAKQEPKKYLEDALIGHLLAVNYNTLGFEKYYHQRLTNELAELIEVEDQYQYLQSREYEFARPPFRKSNWCYDVRRKRITQILLDFVQLELSIRSKRAAQLREEARIRSQVKLNKEVAAKEARDNYKIRTSMSVAVLAYLVKLMIKGKVIEPGVRTELLAFIANIFQTPNSGTDGIAPTSFATRYKDVTESSARTVRVLLLRMLKILDEDFAGLG